MNVQQLPILEMGKVDLENYIEYIWKNLIKQINYTDEQRVTLVLYHLFKIIEATKSNVVYCYRKLLTLLPESTPTYAILHRKLNQLQHS